jgi:Flp pilus assembly protein TadG
MHTRRLAACPRRPRQGLLNLELLLTLPVVTLLLIGLIEFACLTSGYESVARASQAGARTALQIGTSPADVASAIKQSLGEQLAADAELRCESTDAAVPEIVCSVRVPMSACGPNLLWPVGFDLQGRFIECTTRTAVAASASDLRN